MAAKKKVKQLAVGAFVATEKLKLRAPARRGSMYDGIYDSLAKLKKGQSFTVPVPKGLAIRTLQNRINAAIRRGPVEAPAGTVFRKNTTADGKIAVCCLAKGEAEESEKRFADRKAKQKAKKAAPKRKKLAVKKEATASAVS